MPAHNSKSLLGQTFGSVTVVGQAEKTARRQLQWHVQCECGRSHVVRGDHLRTGWQCYHGQARGITKKYPVEYQAWVGMFNRCDDPNNPRFHRYGGRGIKVCDRWRSSFQNFLADMGPKPDPSLSIDRINNDGNYEPGNCRWATALQQANNKSPRRAA